MKIVRMLGLTSPYALAPMTAHAFSGEAANAAADIFVWVVIVMILILAVWLSWKVHVMPEVIAEKRQHPQKEAIKTLPRTMRCTPLALRLFGLYLPVDNYKRYCHSEPFSRLCVRKSPITNEPLNWCVFSSK